jgi:hypothetical protein
MRRNVTLANPGLGEDEENKGEEDNVGAQPRRNFIANNVVEGMSNYFAPKEDSVEVGFVPDQQSAEEEDVVLDRGDRTSRPTGQPARAAMTGKTQGARAFSARFPDRPRVRRAPTWPRYFYINYYKNARAPIRPHRRANGPVFLALELSSVIKARFLRAS